MKRVLPLTLLAFAVATSTHAAEQDNAVPVTVTRAVSRSLPIDVTAPGELESPSDPVIAAETDGQVLKVMTQEGDSVGAQQILATLDPEPSEIVLEKAQASVARSEAVIANQKLTVQRLQDLRRRQASAQSELDKAETELAAGRAELAAARAQVRDAKYQLAKTELRSPIAGVVQARYISAGDYVKRGDRTFEIVAADVLSARLFIPETLATKIHAGLPVEMHAGMDTQTVKATISRVLPALDPTNRSLAVIADFNNQHHWRPGLSVTATITMDTHEHAVMVPVHSVVRRPAGTVVYRIDNGRAAAQPVELGQQNGDEVEIVSGLQGDAVIALDGAGFLTDGAAVEVRNAKP